LDHDQTKAVITEIPVRTLMYHVGQRPETADLGRALLSEASSVLSDVLHRADTLAEHAMCVVHEVLSFGDSLQGMSEEDSVRWVSLRRYVDGLFRSSAETYLGAEETAKEYQRIANRKLNAERNEALRVKRLDRNEKARSRRKGS
jgi:hypothetical protein